MTITTAITTIPIVAFIITIKSVIAAYLQFEFISIQNCLQQLLIY